MNIFTAHFSNCIPHTSVKNFVLDKLDFEKSLAWAGLALDQYIFFENKSVDIVCVLLDDKLDYAKMETIISAMPYYNDTVYFANGNIESSFFCRPAIFHAICNMYKIDFAEYTINGNSDTATFGQKLACLLNRLNFSAEAC